MYTSHIVPAMSNIPEASETPRTYQGMTFPPRKYEWVSREARFDTQWPTRTDRTRKLQMMTMSIVCRCTGTSIGARV